MKDLGYYVPAVLLATGFACRVPGMRRTWRDPLLRTVNTLLIVASSVLFFAAPTTIALVNRVTGVPNFSGPLVYSILTAYNAACLVMIINWRGGAPPAAPPGPGGGGVGPPPVLFAPVTHTAHAGPPQ
ncbi:hypothetical protein ACFXPM_14190, partial [Streptomyces sp. NPDC059095]